MIPKTKKIPISVTIQYDLQEKMAELAKQNANSVSAEYNKAIKMYVDFHFKGKTK